MPNDLEALLALQADDAVVDGLESRLADLGPREENLERQRQLAEDALSRASTGVEADEKKQRELERRVADHRQRQERNLANLEAVKRLREATAAMAQVEQAKKLLFEEESELHTLVRRVAEGHRVVETQRQALETLAEEQRAERDAIAAEKGALESDLEAAQAKRTEAAALVSRSILAKYDRIRSRQRDDALYSLRGHSCGNCDTAIPLQRRNQIAIPGTIDVCEACGVLLYASV